MTTNENGRSARGAVVSTAGKLKWSGRARRVPENWKPGTYWGIGPTKEAAITAAMAYVKCDTAKPME